MKALKIFGLLSTFAFAALAIQSGCASDAACSALTEGVCPTKAPSYATDVAPLLATYCTSCHVAGGEEADRPLDTYAAAAQQASSMQSEVKDCDMPPSDATQPTAAERQILLDWIACGAPQ